MAALRMHTHIRIATIRPCLQDEPVCTVLAGKKEPEETSAATKTGDCSRLTASAKAAKAGTWTAKDNQVFSARYVFDLVTNHSIIKTNFRCNTIQLASRRDN